MDIDLQAIMVTDSIKDSNNLYLANPVFRHLLDHDYVPKTPRTYENKTKQLKITKLKAIYNCTVCGFRTMNRDLHNKHICETNTHLSNIEEIPKGYEKCTKCYVNKSKKLEVIPNTDQQNQSPHCMLCIVPKNKVDTFYECPTCSFKTKKRSSLMIHMHVHSRGSPFKCFECLHSASSLKELLKHYDTVKDLKCDCGFSTHIKQRMTKHLRSHNRKTPARCGFCNFNTCDQPELRNHVQSKHIMLVN